MASIRASLSDLTSEFKELTRKELKSIITDQSSPSRLYRREDEEHTIQPLSRKELKTLVTPQSQEGRRFSLEKRRETLKFCGCSDRIKAYKNLLGIYISFTACFGSFLAIISLQSSINSEAGLGFASSAVVYATLIVATLFTPGYIKLIGTKYSLIFAYVLFLLYTLCNYYPSWFTLIPGAILNGIGQPPIFISAFGHAISVALHYTSALNETPENAIALFTGVVASSIKAAQITGSLISSFILINVDEGNSTNYSDVCQSLSGPPVETGPIYYSLISTYVIIGIFGITVAFVLMDHFGTEQSFVSPTQMCKLYLWKHIITVLKTLVNWKMVLIFPMLILNGLKIGFITGTFPKVYILDCVGIQWIGFALAVYGTGGAISAFVSGRIVRYMPQLIVVYGALMISLALVLFLILWEREPSFVFIFLFCFAWGIAESTYNSVCPGLLGQWFQGNQKEAALGLQQVGLAIGFIISFVGGIYLTVSIQLYILASLVILTAITYTLVFFLTASKAQLIPCCMKEPESRSSSDITEESKESPAELKSEWPANFNPLSTRPSITVNGTVPSIDDEQTNNSTCTHVTAF